MTTLLLSERVRELITNSETVQKNIFFDSAVIEAMRLADLFESIKPQEYILPLDAMAGFPVISRTTN
jgi:hypothetical protein